jgi:hypothetical protein
VSFNSDRYVQLITQTESARAILVTWKKTSERKIVVEYLSRDMMGGERWTPVAEYHDSKAATDADHAVFELLCQLSDEQIPPFR